MAVSTMKGAMDDKQFEEERDKLLEKLSRDGVEVSNPLYWETYRYNPPWTIPSMRTNEVAIQLLN